MASRPLSAAESAYAREVFGDSLDCARVWLTRDSAWSAGAPKAIRCTIHLKSTWGHFAGETLDLTDEGLLVLVHELAHVWQYQNAGLGYIPSSLWAQAYAWLHTGSRGGAYRWREPHAAGTPWPQWNPEQQAQAIEEYNRAWRRVRAGSPREGDALVVQTLQPFIDAVRRGEGAAGWKR